MLMWGSSFFCKIFFAYLIRFSRETSTADLCLLMKLSVIFCDWIMKVFLIDGFNIFIILLFVRLYMMCFKIFLFATKSRAWNTTKMGIFVWMYGSVYWIGLGVFLVFGVWSCCIMYEFVLWDLCFGWLWYLVCYINLFGCFFSNTYTWFVFIRFCVMSIFLLLLMMK